MYTNKKNNLKTYTFFAYKIQNYFKSGSLLENSSEGLVFPEYLYFCQYINYYVLLLLILLLLCSYFTFVQL